MTELSLTVNGREVTVDVPPMTRLLDVLRDHLGHTGTKEGCGEGECGACAVLLDSRLVNSCLVPALQADGATIVTVEGLAPPGAPTDVQQAFVEAGAVQCGFCTPGLIIAAHDLLDRLPEPTEIEIREELSGNVCRCTGYGRIIDAVQRVAVARRTHADGGGAVAS